MKAVMDTRASIAVDLGAESCRVSLLRWIDGAPTLTLMHRFNNGPVKRADGLRWPLSAIEAGVDEGMRKCAVLSKEGIRSVAVDGWAVDYVRLDRQGKPVAEPFCYRDERTVEAERRLHKRISAERLREITGVQQLRINTLNQLCAEPASGNRWVNLPEYMLSRWGAEPVAEYTNATHTQLVDLQTRAWSGEIFQAAGLEVACAPRLVPPGAKLGKLSGRLKELAAFCDTELIAPACHDTASAIAGIAATGDDWAYISSGTWSLVGMLTDAPVNDRAAWIANFTNLGAVGGRVCFHKSVNGMWLLKQCMDAWLAEGGEWRMDDLLAAAETIDAPDVLLEVDEPELMLVGEMPRRINAQRKRTGSALLDESANGAPALTSLILHSLAARYAQVLTKVSQHSGKHLKRLFIVGGGSRNALLNRLTAEATGLQVICGAVESATIGNFAVQLAVLERAHAAGDPGFAGDVARWAGVLQPVMR